jgi:8-oxo-dGTP pyrophosphatase MutT (NUDIX family)
MAKNERSAGFVIYRNADNASREYLLLDYGRHWDFVKGHVEKDEDDLTTAIRELKEETGIADAVVIPGFQHEVRYVFRDRKKGLVHKKVIFFLGRTAAHSDEIVLSREHEGYTFLPFEAALKRLTFPTARQVLRLAEQSLLSAGNNADNDSLSPQSFKP